jgi:RDD family
LPNVDPFNLNSIMKITKHILPVLCLSICTLLLARPVMAQETNNPPTNSETAALTETVSNATELAATNDAETNGNPEVELPNNVQPLVLFAQNAELKTNEIVEAVVVIGGSARIHGHVHEAVVVIGGDVEVDGEVGDAVVAICGSIHVKPGAIIHQDAVAIMGSISAESGTKIGSDTVAIGGKLEIADGAIVKGEKVNIGLPGPLANIEWLRDWIKYCVFEARPLSLQVGFVWVIAAVFFLIYLLIAAMFPRPVQVCVEDLDRRPATLFLMGLLTKLLVPFVYLILAVTGVGLIVAPFIWVALLLCAIVGKVALIEWIGLKVGSNFGGGFQKPLVAFLLGTIIITLLYLIPVVGFLTYIILGVWGLGCGVTAAFSRLRRESPDKSVPPAPPAAFAPASPVAPAFIDPNTAPTPGIGANLESPVVPGTMPSSPPPVAPIVSSFPKAGLWERLCAAFLDIILIFIVSGIAHVGPFKLIIALAYFAGMWTWRGTTVGGIVLKLKVVRTDGRPLTFVVALVRGLAATFSVAILFLGFLWIAWDKDKQGWHDKIAGTEVVRLPHSAPLVVL